jgi:Carboxylesterase family
MWSLSPVTSPNMLLSLIWLLLSVTTTVQAARDGAKTSNWKLYGPQPTVSVDSGPLVGTTTSLPYATASVAQFLGVPFADKPKRFLPPERPKPWTKPRKAQKWKSACIQQFNSK